MAHYNGSTDKETIAHLKEINAELLTALEKLYDACAPYEHFDVVVGDACDTTIATIVKAEGGAAQVQSAEEAVIASIPTDLYENMRKADEAFKASGGCKGCGSMVIAVHRGGCPTLADDLY